MTEAFVAPDPPRRTGLRETVAAALMLSAAAHAGAVYWAVAGGASREAAPAAGGTVAIEVRLVQGPGEPAAARKPGAEDGGARHARAETGPAADRIAAGDSVAATPFPPQDDTAPSALQHAPGSPEAAPPLDAAAWAVAPQPPPRKPALREPPARAPAEDAASVAALPSTPTAQDVEKAPTHPQATAGGPDSPSGAEGAQAAAPLAGNPAPDYPYAARLRGQHGSVLLRVEVAASGDAGNVRIERSSGYESLDRAAAQAVRRWRFRPAQRDGAPVATTVQVPVRFDLR